MKIKLFLGIALLTLFQNVSAMAPTKCPSTASLQAGNLTKVREYSQHIYQAWAEPASYGTEEQWTFMVTNIVGNSLEKAMDAARTSVAKKLEYQLGPYFIGARWVCDYRTLDSRYGVVAITPPY